GKRSLPGGWRPKSALISRARRTLGPDRASDRSEAWGRAPRVGGSGRITRPTARFAERTHAAWMGVDASPGRPARRGNRPPLVSRSERTRRRWLGRLLVVLDQDGHVGRLERVAVQGDRVGDHLLVTEQDAALGLRAGLERQRGELVVR